MDNSRRNYLPVTLLNESSDSPGNDVPFYPESRSSNQEPWLFSTNYATLPGGHGQGIDPMGTQTIVHPRVTIPMPHFHIPFHIRDQIDGSLTRPSLQGSGMINGCLSCDLGPFASQYVGLYSALPGECDPQLIPRSMSGYTQPPPAVAPSLVKVRATNVTSNVSAPKRRAHDLHWICPICYMPLGRAQERRRHTLLHLPYWLQCPDPSCSWRGDRWENLNKHWHNVHPSSVQGSQAPDKSHSIIYNPRPLVRGVTEGRTSIENATVVAISMVERRASELGKSWLWGDLWGRKGRKARRLGGSIS